MRSITYSFDQKEGLLNNKIFLVRDYFQYYTTGVEQIIPDNTDAFAFVTRENAERPEQIMYDMFRDANLGDMFCAINNQNYLWATPFGLDAFQDAIEFRFNYVELLMRDRIEKTEVKDDLGTVIETYYNDVGDLCRERVEEDIHYADDVARLIIIPDLNSHQFVNRKIEEYFNSRIVK